jgi:hypothetical protein
MSKTNNLSTNKKRNPRMSDYRVSIPDLLERNHRYMNRFTGQRGFSGFPQDRRANTLYLNTCNPLYRDTNGCHFIHYEIPPGTSPSRVNVFADMWDIRVIVFCPGQPLKVVMCKYRDCITRERRHYMVLEKW